MTMQPPAGWPMHPALVTTADHLPGFRILRTVGVAQGVTVQFITSINNSGLPGVNEAYKRARRDSLIEMMKIAIQYGGNAVIGVRHDHSVWTTYVEFVSYGTAAIIEPSAG